MLYISLLYIVALYAGLVSTIQQSESFMHIHKPLSFWISFPFRCRFNPWVGKIPRSRKWQPTLVFLPGESHGRRSLVGYSPRGHKEQDTTERLSSFSHVNFLKYKRMKMKVKVKPLSLRLHGL